ncbi:MAG: glycosyltransferase [Deltaproteobacteria bacterium]|nr:glycosyltransferase [Deltaproteobacteria bacterium]
MPQISIILPTFNRASLIGRAIESVLNQTFNYFEVIIVDNASTDFFLI